MPGDAEPIVELVARTDGAKSSVATVTDTGVLTGSQFFGDDEVATFWTAPDRPVAIPPYRENSGERLLAVSPSGRYYAGFSRDAGNSVIPKYGFVHDTQTDANVGIEIEGYDRPAVTTTEMGDDGIAKGFLMFQEGGFSHGRRFTYNLASKELQLTPAPTRESDLGTPPNTPHRTVTAYSDNGEYAVGYVGFGDDVKLARWHVATREVTLLGPLVRPMDPWMISNDGRRIVLYDNQPNGAYFLWENGKTRNVMKTIQAAGYGADWTRLNFLSISPTGQYLACTGMTDARFKDAVRIRLY